jgi:hypothetical protein
MSMKWIVIFAAALGLAACDRGSSQSSLGNMGPSQDREPPIQTGSPTASPSVTP